MLPAFSVSMTVPSASVAWYGIVWSCTPLTSRTGLPSAADSAPSMPSSSLCRVEPSGKVITIGGGGSPSAGGSR